MQEYDLETTILRLKMAVLVLVLVSHSWSWQSVADLGVLHSELDMGWVNPWAGLGHKLRICFVLCWVMFYLMGWVGS